MLREVSHLWDIEHPYGPASVFSPENTYASWRKFTREFGKADVDYNLVWRWDWIVHDPEKEEHVDPPVVLAPHYEHTLFLQMAHQRKGTSFEVEVEVQPEDEEAVRKWLEPHWKRLQEMWAPLSGGEP